MGSVRITLAPTTTAAAVSSMGRKRIAPASITASASGAPWRTAQLDEVDKDDRIAHDDAGAGDEADHRCGSEERSQHRMRRQNANQRQRNRRHDDQRHNERPEPAHHEHVDKDEHRGERQAQDRGILRW